MLTSHELFGFMSRDLALEIITFVQESDKQLYRTVLAAVAEARKVRPVFLERQPRTQRHEVFLTTLAKPALEIATSSLVRAWLLKKYKGMLTDFLDALGIAHQDGVVEELPETADDAKLAAAIELLLGKYPPEAVSVYLNAFNDMNEVEWPNLKKLLESDARLQLHG